jgi:hypothetical protein
VKGFIPVPDPTFPKVPDLDPTLKQGTNEKCSVVEKCNFFLIRTGTFMHSGSGSGSGSNIKWSTRVKKVKKSKVR